MVEYIGKNYILEPDEKFDLVNALEEEGYEIHWSIVNNVFMDAKIEKRLPGKSIGKYLGQISAGNLFNKVQCEDLELTRFIDDWIDKNQTTSPTR